MQPQQIDTVDPSGTLTVFAGAGSAGFSDDGGPALSAQLWCPGGVRAGPDGSFYIVDHANNRIRRVDRDGIITAVAGNGALGFSGDGGPATSAMLNSPGGIAFDAGGDLFISDRGNHRVRKVEKNGTIRTVVGGGR